MQTGCHPITPMKATMTPTTSPLPRRTTAWIPLIATTMLTAIIGLGMANRAEAQPAPQHAGHHRMAPGMGMAGMGLPERMLDDVGASADQKAKLRDIFKAAGDDMRTQHEAGRALHGKMLALLAAPQVDAAAAEALRQQQLAQHDTVTKRALQAMLDAQAVLTPEQRAKLAERMAKRHQMREHRRDHRAPDAPKS